MSQELRRSVNSLKQIWASLLDEENINNYDSDDDCQALFLLLETAVKRTKCISSSNSILKTSNEKLLSEIDRKAKECNKLKLEVERLENATCQKCFSLEAEMVRYKKKAFEAQNRMKSIANILRIGENLSDSQSPRKNSAFTLVSQMLLEESPKRKKRCIEKSSPQPKTTGLAEDVNIADCETVVPETMPAFNNSILLKTPPKADERGDMITSPDDDSVITSQKPDLLKPPLSINLPLNSSSSHVRKNLTSDFQKQEPTPTSSKRRLNSSFELDASLAEYVKESNSGFDKIWFTASSSKALETEEVERGRKKVSNGLEDIVDETPEKSPQKKKKAIWKMEEMKGPSQQTGRVRLRQMKLSVREKRETKDVDLSKLSGYDGGLGDNSNSLSKTPIPSKKTPLKLRKGAEEEDEIELPNTELSEFKPKATSTQKLDAAIGTCRIDDETIETPNYDGKEFNPKSTSTQNVPGPSSKKVPNSPNYNYKRETVRKKSERAKLDGWDCTNCAEYYAAIGETDPKKLKGRMNKCSRHRDKFKPLTNTPPGYWDPIFPDTEECRQRGYYTSFKRNT